MLARSDRSRVAAYWCRIPSRVNFGDALTPWLIRKISGRLPAYREHSHPGTKLVMAGSILSHARAGAIVWGAGIMSRTDRIDPLIDIRAIRGPLSRARALECGARCPDVLGDPGLLLPRFYAPPRQASNNVGVALHFSDAAWAGPHIAGRHGLRPIDIQAGIERVVDEIAASPAIASSSLHAIIAAHAYGVPAVWLRLGDLPSGDGTKFEDYFRSVGLAADPLERTPSELDPDEILSLAKLPSRLPDLDALWACCPIEAQC